MAHINPFVGAHWFIDPYSNAQHQVNLWHASRPGEAQQLGKIAKHASADWFGDWSGDVHTAVANRTAQILAAGALPVYVVYNIPNRDCGGSSFGGADPAHYLAWIGQFASGIGNHRAVVILEPDALAQAAPGQACSGHQHERCQLLSQAVSILKSLPNIAVYIDAGNPNWIDAATMAALLTLAGIAQADGFALNVSNFAATTSCFQYGDDISQRIDDKAFVIDTSRNGQPEGDPSDVLNPPGRGLGKIPGSPTFHARCEAFLWIKRPGESDGSAHGGPKAGDWWPEYALGLCVHSNL